MIIFETDSRVSKVVPATEACASSTRTRNPGLIHETHQGGGFTINATNQTFTICTTLSFCSSTPNMESVDAPLCSFPNPVLRGIQFHVLKCPGNFADFCRAVGTNCLIQVRLLHNRYMFMQPNLTVQFF